MLLSPTLHKKKLLHTSRAYVFICCVIPRSPFAWDSSYSSGNISSPFLSFQFKERFYDSVSFGIIPIILNVVCCFQTVACLLRLKEWKRIPLLSGLFICHVMSVSASCPFQCKGETCLSELPTGHRSVQQMSSVVFKLQQYVCKGLNKVGKFIASPQRLVYFFP